MKFIKKVVHEQTTKFSHDNSSFYKYQSGFRSNHSTDLFVSLLNDKLLKDFENRIYTFDTINNKILRK